MEPTVNSDPTQTAVFGAVNTGEFAATHPGLKVDAVQAIQELPQGSALLVVQRGPNVGARFLLNDERVTAGRSPSADIFLDDVTVSRKHAEFLRTPQGYVVRDTGSLNGTYVNRERVEKAVLVPGTEVQIGKYRMTYHPAPATAAGQN